MLEGHWPVRPTLNTPQTQMKEYKLKPISLKPSGETYLLEPLYPGEKPHYIQFDTLEEAHKAKLALGLGTLRDPLKSPDQYQVLTQEIEGIKIYKIIPSQNLNEQNDHFDAIDSCCFSGCTGCPIYAKKMFEE
jgi:hypothetical protein